MHRLLSHRRVFIHELLVIVQPKSAASIRPLVAAIDQLVRRYDRTTPTRRPRGRPDTARRDALLVDLGKQYRRYTSWDRPQAFKGNLREFLELVFAVYGFDVPNRVLRLLPSKVANKSPRANPE